MRQDLHVVRFAGTDPNLEPYIKDLASLRIRVFRDFPYLYDGTSEYEERYLQTYTRCADSIVVLVLDGNQVVGATTGLPMEAETEEFQKPFIDRGLDPSKIFYCAESVMLPEYRGRGIYPKFFAEREGHALRLNRFDLCCFCCVERPVDHPLRPKDFTPLDPIWSKFGYRKHPELKTTYEWKDVNEDQESAKPMVFWLKELTHN